MSIIGSNILAGASGTVETGYQISRSLRFNSADSAYLTKTYGSAGNRKTWTVSLWMKRSALSAVNNFAGSTNSGGTTGTEFYFTSGDALTLDEYVSSASQFNLTTTQVFRDVSAFYHILFAVDTTQATSSNRVKIYVNGTQITAFSTATYPTQNLDTQFNFTSAMSFGRNGSYASGYFNGYMADIIFIDGQALDPTSFGETDATTGVWVPKAYTGTYGTNGFWLKFDDNSGTTSTTLGKDSSGNGNNWTPNNFSVTAGVGNDSLVDSPTWYGTDTGAGGEVRGNYCTLNPLDSGSVSASNGNLESTVSGANGTTPASSFVMTSGKWYWEITCTHNTNDSGSLGVVRGNISAVSAYRGANPSGVYYECFTGTKNIDGTNSSYGAAWGGVGSTYTMSVALDADAGTVTFYKNGVSQGAITLPTSTAGWKAIAGFSSSSGSMSTSWNFGQRPFAYTAPSGFKALVTTNLPTPAIGASASTLASKNFDITTYTGTNTTKVISGFGFQPDFLWFKNRAYAAHHAFVDVIRGVTKQLQSSTTNAESTNSAGKGVQSFNSDGFTLGQESDAVGGTNDNTAGQNSYVTWMWKAGGTAVSNTAGSISSSVSANTAAGISVVTYTGNGTTGATIGHGLGKAPSMIMVKSRDTQTVNSSWSVYHASLGNTKVLVLNTTAAADTNTNWNNTTPSSTVFTVNDYQVVNTSTKNYVAYCFAEVPGFSKFGSYTGNASTDGPFVYTGFRPKFVLVKNSSTTGSWWIDDSARDTYNVASNKLAADSSAAESTGTANFDFLSNGFKVRNSGTELNGSGNTIIFMAFAEAPLNYSRAR